MKSARSILLGFVALLTMLSLGNEVLGQRLLCRRMFSGSAPHGRVSEGRGAPTIGSGGFQAGMGIMVGEVTATSAVVQVRLTQTDRLVNHDVPGVEGVVRFEVRAEGSSATKFEFAGAKASRDYIARAVFTELQPGTRYICTTQIFSSHDPRRSGPVARFKTHPGKAPGKVRFVVVTGMNHAKFHGDNRIDGKQHLIENNTNLPAPYSGPDKHLGYPALKSILDLRPDFFVGTGDNVYYDTPKKPRAETITEMRRKWHEQFVQPRYRDLFAAVPTYWMIDDHDYRVDDCDNTGDYRPTPAEGRRVMLEQLPIAASEDEDKSVPNTIDAYLARVAREEAGDEEDDSVKTYRTHRVSRDLQIWFPENRMYRSPNKMPDGPDKSIWGARQKAWLKKTLLASDAKFKLLVSPTPMIGPDDLRKTDNHTNVGGFRHERDEFFAWLKTTGIDKKHFYMVCGDRHWQYHAVDPSGLEEFSCGALVDANSRLGRKPGDPKSTDAKGLIKQPYYQTPRSGGFLMIEVEPQGDSASLAFVFHDEHGKVLHRHVKK